MVTFEQIQSAIESDNYVGFCTKCGEEAHNVDPDATNYKCESCGELAVFGAEELLIAGKYDGNEEPEIVTTPAVESVIVEPPNPRAMSIRQMLAVNRSPEFTKELYESTGLVVIDGGKAVVWMNHPTRHPHENSKDIARFDKKCREMLQRETTCILSKERRRMQEVGEKELVIVTPFVPSGAANEVCIVNSQFIRTAEKHANVRVWKYSPDKYCPAIIGFNKAGNAVAIIATIENQ